MYNELCESDRERKTIVCEIERQRKKKISKRNGNLHKQKKGERDLKRMRHTRRERETERQIKIWFLQTE